MSKSYQFAKHMESRGANSKQREMLKGEQKEIVYVMDKCVAPHEHTILHPCAICSHACMLSTLLSLSVGIG